LERQDEWRILPNRITLFDLDGITLATSQHSVTNVTDVSVSPSLTRVAFWGEDRLTGKVGLFHTMFGSDNISLIIESSSPGGVPSSSSLSWSPSEDQIVFSSSGRVFSYDTDHHSTLEIALGTNPAWSPDGKWIVFRSPKGLPVLLTASSFRQTTFGRGRKIQAHMQWSPDSKYVLVSEEAPAGKTAACYGDERLVVYRISDGAASEVYNPCGRKDILFGWVLDP